MFGFNEEKAITNCEPGVTRKILNYSEKVMMCELHFDKGAKGNFHHHPHEQVTYIVSGAFDFTVDGETKTVRAGDSVLMPGNSEHGVTCVEEGVIVDVFAPMREDFL